MKRKLVGMILTAVMLTTLFTGCTVSDGSSETKVDTVQEEKNSVEGETQEVSEEGVSEVTSTGNVNTSDFDDYKRPIIKEEGLTLAYIHNLAYNEAEQRKMGQIKLECEHRGWNFVEANYNEDSEWSDTFKNLITQGVDCIVITNTESMQAKSPVIIQAREAGIGVYCNDSEVVPGIICNSTMPNGVATEELFYKIGNDSKWTSDIGLLTVEATQVHTERIDPVEATCKSYANMNVLEKIDVTGGGSDFITFTAETVKTWFQKYGTQLKGVYASCDNTAYPAVEAAEQSGDLVDPDFWVAGIDGGSECWARLREGGYFKYNYSQAFEMYSHKLCDVIEQIQVKGLNPGDAGCDIGYSGDILYTYGKVVTQDNVPDVGTNVHMLFDYYDPDPDSWCNWEGTYTVSE